MAEIAYPAILFIPGSAGPDARSERFLGIPDQQRLRTARGGDLRSGARIGATLVDNTGRTLSIRGVQRLRYRTPMVLVALGTLLGQSDDMEHVVDYEFDELAPLPWSAVRQRVCAAIDRSADEWIDDEAVDAEEARRRAEAALYEAKTAVAQSANVLEILGGLDAAWARTIPAPDPPSDETAPGNNSVLGGRGGRLEFAVGTGTLAALLAALIVFLERGFPDGLGSAIPTLIGAPFFFGPIIGIAVLTTRRLHDCGVTALWIWVAGVGVRIVVAIVNGAGFHRLSEPLGLGIIGLLLLVLAAIPGTPGANKFGPLRRASQTY